MLGVVFLVFILLAVVTVCMSWWSRILHVRVKNLRDLNWMGDPRSMIRNRMRMAVCESEVLEEAGMPLQREGAKGVDWDELARMETKPLLEEIQNNDLIREKVPLLERIVAEVESGGGTILKKRTLPKVLNKDSFDAVVVGHIYAYRIDRFVIMLPTAQNVLHVCAKNHFATN